MAASKRVLFGVLASALCVLALVFERTHQGTGMSVLLESHDPLEASLKRELKADEVSKAVLTARPAAKAAKGARLAALPIKGASQKLASRGELKDVLTQNELAFSELRKDNALLRHEVESLSQKPKTDDHESMLEMQNEMLQREVHDLEKSLKNAKVMRRHHAKMNVKPRKTQGLAAIDTPMATKWWKDNHPGGGTLPILNGIQGNPLDFITSEDPVLDPYDPSRHYLRAPLPHDPASSLIKTVTGDYGSPMTYKDIVNNKRTIDWCVTNFDWITDREKCIERMNKGPLLM